MPNNTLKFVSDTLNKPLKEIEDLWTKAEDIVEREYDTVGNYALIMAVSKKMLGNPALDKLDWDLVESKLQEEYDDETITEPKINGGYSAINVTKGISFKDYIQDIT